ncbi:MAG: hypothetical protein KA474_00435 [Acinetobacter sp.]|nr:hypothetical protein [Acinetobacter sp.]
MKKINDYNIKKVSLAQPKYLVLPILVCILTSFIGCTNLNETKQSSTAIGNLISHNELVKFTGSSIVLISKNKKQNVYQFRLKKLQNDKFYLAANTSYYLKIKGYRFNPDPNLNFYVGKTDQKGQTIEIKTNQALKPSDVTLVEHYGNRDIGIIFSLKSDDGPVSNMPYTILLKCPNAPLKKFYGISDEQGNSMHIGTHEPCNADIYAGINEEL